MGWQQGQRRDITKEKRREKKLKEQQGERDTSVAEDIKAGKAEMDVVSIAHKEDYKMPAFVPGYISLDGLTEPEPEAEKSEDN